MYVANNMYDPAAKADLKHTASPPGVRFHDYPYLLPLTI